MDEKDTFEKQTPDKIQRILQACDDGDINAICELACGKGGLVNDECRKRACELFVNGPDEEVRNEMEVTNYTRTVADCNAMYRANNTRTQ